MDLFQLPRELCLKTEIKTRPDEQSKAQMGSKVGGAGGR